MKEYTRYYIAFIILFDAAQLKQVYNELLYLFLFHTA